MDPPGAVAESAPAGNAAPMSSAEEAYEPACMEIERRCVVKTTCHSNRDDTASTGTAGQGDADAVAKPARPHQFLALSDTENPSVHDRFQLRLPRVSNQRYALLTVGTRVLAPRPLDDKYPSLRIYGTFETRQDASDHAEVVREKDGRCSLIVVPCGEWFLFPQSEEILRDPSTAEERLHEKLSQYLATRDAQSEEFECARTEPETSRKVNWSMDMWDEAQEETLEAENDVYPRPRRLRAGAEVRNQSACACCLLRDNEGKGECVVSVLGAFESSRDADEWVSSTAVPFTTEFDVFVCSLCEWIYPNSDKATTERDVYRVSELQKIMDTARSNPRNVMSFKTWKESQSADPWAPPSQRRCHASPS